MSPLTCHSRILEFPHTRSLINARLDDLREETHGARRELIFDYQELRLLAPPELIAIDGRPHEYLRGEYVPRRLRFRGLRWIDPGGVFMQLANVPLTDRARLLDGLFCWRDPYEAERCLLLDHSDPDSGLWFSARDCVPEERAGSAQPIEMTRDWSQPPSLSACLIPRPLRLHQRYGGDSITIHLNGRTFHRRLFVGGKKQHPDQRPDVDVVLNLAEDEDHWILASADRHVPKGEGALGMDIAEILAEKQWVVEHLQAGRRVLVHCSRGLNRSVTICCAALMQLENLSAEAALARIRERHPLARPDSYHWLRLRWIAHTRML